MLSRDLCEKLAEAYPGIKHRAPVTGQLRINAGGDIWVFVDGARDANGQLLGASSDEVNASLWCPHLEDLLAVAVNQVAPPGPRYVSLENSSPGLMLDPGWSFGVPAEGDDWDDSLPVREASTPEESIALWLLDMADKERGEREDGGA